MPPISVPVPLEVCTTQACIDAAASMQNYINFNVDPCDDFWEFSCGTFLENAKVDVNTTTMGTFDDMRDDILASIRDILSSSYEDLLRVDLAPDFIEGANYSSSTDQELFGFLQEYYTSCMDTNAINTVGPTPLYPLIVILDEIAATSTSWFSDLVGIHTALAIHTDVWGAPALFGTSVLPNANNPTESAIYIHSPKYTYLTGVDITDSTAVKDLNTIISRAVKAILSPDDPAYQDKAKQLGLNLWPTEDIEWRVKNATQFTIALITASEQESVNYLDPTVNYNGATSLTKLQEDYPIIDWATYLRYFVPSEQPLPEQVLNYGVVYFETLTSLIAETDLQTVKDYLTIQIIMTHFTNLDETTQSTALGTRLTAERWVTCAGYVRENFDHVIGRYYVMEKFGGGDKREQVNQFVTNIHQVWRQRLEVLDWLDDSTRAKAIEKIDKVGQWIAYSIENPNSQSPDSLAEYLNPMVFSESFASNQFTASYWASTKKKYGGVGKPVDRAAILRASPANFNAYYASAANYMGVLAGIIQEPLYSADYPAYINYGALGSVIGHEFTHGFDDAGRNYDGDGRLTVWWTNHTSQEFEERSQCFIDQYSDYYVTDENNAAVYVDGEKTLGENLADNGGIAASYQAFTQLWNSGTVKKMSLPDINLTPDQLFFTSFARFYCEAKTPKALVNQIAIDNHSPNRVRVLAAVKNSQDFAKAYNCPSGSKMNPPAAEKCTLW